MRQTAPADVEGPPSVLPVPASSGEYITLLAHYHRGELQRVASWRERIDLTTNWAITVVGAMLSLALSSARAHHGIMLLAMVLTTLFLTIEARRYRFFDVYRNRVRRLERSWYAPIFLAETARDRSWLEDLGRDLEHPQFVMSQAEAMSRRLRRAYCWIYLILLLAWLFKTTSMPDDGSGPAPVRSVGVWLHNAAVGPLPGGLVGAIVAAFYGWLLYIALRHRKSLTAFLHGEVHV